MELKRRDISIACLIAGFAAFAALAASAHLCSVTGIKSAPGGLNLYMLPYRGNVPLSVQTLSASKLRYIFDYNHVDYYPPGSQHLSSPKPDPVNVFYLAYGQKAAIEGEDNGCEMTAEKLNGQTILRVEQTGHMPGSGDYAREEIVTEMGHDDSQTQSQ